MENIKMDILKIINKKRILILGFGREGVSSYHFIRKHFPDKEIGIADVKNKPEFYLEVDKDILKNENVKFHLGKNYLHAVNDYNYVIKTPGIPARLLKVGGVAEDVEISSQTRIFLEMVRGKVVGVTGTKGKSTTASLIHHILSASGEKSVLVGNIGKPCLDYIEKDSKDTIFIYELSSHQLMDITKSPQVSVLLNIYPEHSDYYKSYGSYINAKINITRFQKKGDIFVFNHDSEVVRNIAKDSRALSFGYSLTDKITPNGCYLEGMEIVFSREGKITTLMKVDSCPLKGDHNLSNFLATVIVCLNLGISPRMIKELSRDFKGLYGRLQTVGKYKGVTFINDTLATIPEAALYALDVYKDKKVTLILGGYDRGIEYGMFCEKLATMSNIRVVILIGQTSGKINKFLLQYSFKGEIVNMGNSKMRDIVHTAFCNSKKPSVVLLSPAASSFDMFKDYKDRGDKFVLAVESLEEQVV